LAAEIGTMLLIDDRVQLGCRGWKL
jgi:hypothetical protein